MGNTVNEYVEFLDSVVCGNFPSEEGDPHLYQLVKTFQFHCHPKTCRKCKNSKCRFKFGRFLLTNISLQYRCNTHKTKLISLVY